MPETLRRIPEIEDWSILTGYRGSIAHGMYVPNTDPNSIDDKDIMSIVIPPLSYYFGLDNFGSRGTKEIKEDEWDIVIYEFRKFVNLLSVGNPNVVALLWLDVEHYIEVDDAGQLLILDRKVFNGKHMYKSFVGYAYGQLKRMTHHSFNGYMGQKRKALVEKFGYDTKNAAHLIRLLRMGIEFLQSGEFTVLRPDAKELLEIKLGEWTLEQVQSEAEKLFSSIEETKQRSTLPDGPNMERINQLAVYIVKSTLEDRDGR